MVDLRLQVAPVDAASRSAIVAIVAKAMRDEYVDPEIGTRAAAKLEKALSDGDYDDLKTPVAFAVRLNADLADVAHDKHLHIVAPGQEASPGFETSPPPVSDSGIVRADRLPSDIGYIEVVSFPTAQGFKAALGRAMAALTSTRALIIDLRRNGGGVPEGVAYLLGYFVDPKTPIHVMDLLKRRPGAAKYDTDQLFTSPTPTSYVDKSIYVLTSARTFSAGETFCYVMRTLHRATLVGETTAGGANGRQDLPGGRAIGAQLGMSLPTLKVRSPITGTNWENVGVVPDVAVPADQALRVALEKLGQRPKSGDIAVLSQGSLFHFRKIAHSGAKTTLRRLIEGAAHGRPPYDVLTPAPAASIDSPLIKPWLASLGPIESITFRGPNSAGWDTFEVRFINSAWTWGLSFAPDGRVDDFSFSMIAPREPAHLSALSPTPVP
jgi:hypothetical protein